MPLPFEHTTELSPAEKGDLQNIFEKGCVDLTPEYLA